MNKNPKFDMEEWAKLTAPLWEKEFMRLLLKPSPIERLYNDLCKNKEKTKDKINWNNQ